MKFKLPLLLVAAAFLPACTSSDLDRDGVTTFAGDAIAWNTSLQVVDPWEYGVQDANLKVPAERTGTAGDSDGSSDTGGSGGSQP